MNATLVTGTNGQVGFELKCALPTLGNVTTLTRAEIDLTNEASILASLQQHKPHIIVNAAAYTAVDRAESDIELAMAVNASAPGIMARWAADNGAWLIHYSTDYVFDGCKADPYVEGDTPNPQSIYGRSKWLGEEAVRARGARHIILRTSWVYGCHGSNFLKTILRLARERRSLNVVADQVGAPTSAALIAKVTRTIIQRVAGSQVADNLAGTYHLAAQGSTSWYDYAAHIVREASANGPTFALSLDALKPISTGQYPTPARRPANSRLDCTKLIGQFDVVLPPWQQDVDRVLSRLLSARNRRFSVL